MSKFANFFYIFSKFTTSLLLLVLLLFTSYALYRSYNEVDDVSSKFDDKLIKITNKIEQNFKSIAKDRELNNETKIVLKDLKESLVNQNYEEKLLKLEKENKLMLTQLEKIYQTIEGLETIVISKKNLKENDLNKNNKELFLLKELILSKFKEGQNIKKEIEILESFAFNTPASIFEKLYILQSKKFYGNENLKTEFNTSLSKYIKHSFVIKNQSSAIGFLLKYIDIKPNNLNNYENIDLNVLTLARKNLDFEKYEDSLNQVMSLKDHNLFFNTWINQLRLLIELNKNLSRVL